MVTQRWARVAAGAPAAGMLLVACDDGDSDESGQPATSTSSTSTTLSQVQLDKQKAQRIVLSAADLSGFTQDPPDPTINPNDTLLPGDACHKDNPLLLRLGTDNDPRGVMSPDFTNSDEVTVGSAATFAETEEDARAVITALSATTFPGCFSPAFTTELQKQAEFTNVSTSTARLPAVTVGDSSIGYRSTVRARYTGVSVTLYFDAVFIQKGRGVALVNVTKATSPYANAERLRLVNPVAERLAAP